MTVLLVVVNPSELLTHKSIINHVKTTLRQTIFIGIKHTQTRQHASS